MIYEKAEKCRSEDNGQGEGSSYGQNIRKQIKRKTRLLLRIWSNSGPQGWRKEYDQGNTVKWLGALSKYFADRIDGIHTRNKD